MKLNPLTFLVDLFPLAGLVVLLFSFLSPVPWKLNPSPAMQLRPYVAPEGYLPDIPCTVDNTNLLAALLNNTNATALLPQNTTTDTGVTVQEFFAKGGGGGGGGGSSLGDFLTGLVSSISSASGSGNSLSNIAPHGDFDEHPNATMRLWLGSLGSCSRDLDGRKWCTKPSYRRPKYNISSFVEPNAYIYPAIIQAQTLGRTTLAFIVLAGLSCILSFAGDIESELNWAPIVYNAAILFAEFVTLWVWLANGSIEAAPGSTNPQQFNSINRLYKCNHTTGAVQLTPGTQYYVLLGDHYGLLWASWVLNLVGTVGSIIRMLVDK